VTGRSYMSISF